MNEFNTENFSKRLKALREEQGMNQAELATASGVSKGSIVRYETGRSLPKVDVAVSLARALGCSIDVLSGAVPLVGVPR